MVQLWSISHCMHISIAAQTPFPGEITHYPARHYVIKGQHFNTSCVVTLDKDNVKVSFMWELSNMELRNSSNVTITPAVRIGNQVMGRLIIQNAVFSDNENLKCVVFGTFKRNYVRVSRTSSLHSSVGELVTRYSFQCRVCIITNGEI